MNKASGVVLLVTEPSHAVFLSYASEDAAAAERIATALRTAGIDVWLDTNELRGGDVWDRQIRKQIHDCALFVPIISAHSDARHEGYFRREWRLAVERAGDMSERVAFLVPVVIDDTRDSRADVPDRFREVQWTRLPAGETPPAFVERVKRLLSPQTSAESDSARSVASVTAAETTRRVATGGLSRSRLAVLYIAIAAVAVLAIGYVGLERLRGRGTSVQSASIAVLPLTNESGDTKEQYFSDGISEDLITALSQFPGLKVIGRTSSFQFRDSKEDSRSIGAKLQVAHLLEGSVRRSGDVVRVSAELINTADGSAQWSERYDRPYKDLFALQDEVTRAVAVALRAKLLPGDQAAAQSERPPSGSLEAYNALLQGRFYYQRETDADYRKAIEYYTQATQLDPRYALAWSGLSHAWADLSGYYLSGAAAQEANAEGREAADRALALAPELAAAHVARGHILQGADFDWHGAEAEFRRAMELAPNDAEAKFHLGTQLAAFGEAEPAIELTRQALKIDPLRASWYVWLGKYLSGVKRLDEAERAIRRSIELQPGSLYAWWELTLIEVQRGDGQAALAAASQVAPGMYQDTALAAARQAGSDQNAADAALRTLIEKYAVTEAYQVAQVYAIRNDVRATFEWLDRAWSNRDEGIQLLLYDPFIRRYKNDPRFAAFCRKVGLPVPGETSSGKST